MSDLSKQLDEWLALLTGSGWKGDEECRRAVRELREAGPDRLFPLLVPRLNSPDPEVRGQAALGALYVDRQLGVELVLPLLHDEDRVVRWWVCGLFHDFPDRRAINALVERIREDEDPQVRGTAAYSLGGIGCPSCISALIEALETDHELDQHGHSASSCAATALDDILGTDETRIRLSGSLRKMQSQKPNLKSLKDNAKPVFRDWRESNLTDDTVPICRRDS